MVDDETMDNGQWQMMEQWTMVDDGTMDNGQWQMMEQWTMVDDGKKKTMDMMNMDNGR